MLISVTNIANSGTITLLRPLFLLVVYNICFELYYRKINPDALSGDVHFFPNLTESGNSAKIWAGARFQPDLE